MDLATIIGIVVGFGLVIGSILMGGSLMAFVNIPGVVIVLGGTLAATLISEKLGTFIGAAKVALKAFFAKQVFVDKTINRLVELAHAHAQGRGVGARERGDRRPLSREGRAGCRLTGLRPMKCMARW